MQKRSRLAVVFLPLICLLLILPTCKTAQEPSNVDIVVLEGGDIVKIVSAR